ncbi:MAG TPA: hypothetical protein VFR87_11635 [Nocardioidaceae bacterium]|nr:hypothetical protein [Nocardioidaceae bacterium]
MGAAEELYGLRPEEFVARRNALAKEAKDAGDKELSEQVKKLAKASTAAWVVNMLVRHDPEQVEQILELGAALREAQESMAGDQLRELGKQRRQLTAAVTRQARALAAELGERVGDPIADQVEATLHAAMVDEDAAKAVRTGCLIKPMSVTGTEASGVVESVAVPGALGEAVVRRAPAPREPRPAAKKAAKPELTVVEDNSRAIAEAEQAVRAAEAELADAERRLAKAQAKVEKREARGLQLQGELDELRRKVAELEQRIEANEDELSDAEDARDEREEAVEAARKAVDQARKALEAQSDSQPRR